MRVRGLSAVVAVACALLVAPGASVAVGDRAESAERKPKPPKSFLVAYDEPENYNNKDIVNRQLADLQSVSMDGRGESVTFRLTPDVMSGLEGKCYDFGGIGFWNPERKWKKDYRHLAFSAWFGDSCLTYYNNWDPESGNPAPEPIEDGTIEIAYGFSGADPRELDGCTVESGVTEVNFFITMSDQCFRGAGSKILFGFSIDTRLYVAETDVVRTDFMNGPRRVLTTSG